MPEKLPMWEDLRQYFKDEFGLDTSREGLKGYDNTKKFASSRALESGPRMAMNDRSSSLSGDGIDIHIHSICTIGQVFLSD
ncbi:hypothetical protein N7527_007572 [Penicillium freii]|uniref:Uncharacterized protein n=1 Tax=Penicillium freii TaxID=48697 RepID=A0A101M8Q6_PENFR|nr:hypothetical protein N7527_007572 [Penicillium freii]KUM55890.1 hypothetical protein ACN42_g11345 [Penicillium freii]